MYKRILILIIFVIFMLVPLAYAGTKQLTRGTSSQIRISLSSQSPDPVEPGQIVTAKFKVENQGIETSEEVVVEIFLKYPFTIYNDITKKNLGKLRALSTGADAEIVEFKLKVDENAVEEETEIELKVFMGESIISYIEEELLIDIQTHDAVLDIVSITSSPEQIAPGGDAKVEIEVKNLADSLMKDIRFKLDFTADDLPLAPFQSSSERIMAQLQSGYQDTLTFNIIAEPDATPGLYKIPLNITYNDERGESTSFNDVLAVKIGEIPEIKPFIKKSTVLQAKKEGVITLGIANSGTTGVKFVELFLLPSADYELISTSDYFYIGDIDSDDTESEEIELYVNKRVKDLTMPVKLTYRDANNELYQQQFDLVLNLYSSFQLRKFGVIKTSYTGILFLLILFIVGGYFWYRKKGTLPFLNHGKNLFNYFRRKNNKK